MKNKRKMTVNCYTMSTTCKRTHTHTPGFHNYGEGGGLESSPPPPGFRILKQGIMVHVVWVNLQLQVMGTWEQSVSCQKPTRFDLGAVFFPNIFWGVCPQTLLEKCALHTTCFTWVQFSHSKKSPPAKIPV